MKAFLKGFFNVLMILAILGGWMALIGGTAYIFGFWWAIFVFGFSFCLAGGYVSWKFDKENRGTA